MKPKWQHLSAGTIISMHWITGYRWPRCKFCGCAFKAMTSARPSGVAWIWNGVGGLICPGPQPGDTPVIDLTAWRGITFSGV